MFPLQAEPNHKYLLSRTHAGLDVLVKFDCNLIFSEVGCSKHLSCKLKSHNDTAVTVLFFLGGNAMLQ